MTIAVTMCKLLAAMGVGFFLTRRQVLDAEANKKFSSMIIKVTCPLLIVSSADSVSAGSEADVLLLLIAGAATYLLLPLLSSLIVKLLRVEKDCTGTYRCMIMLSNCMFMGYPVVEALFGGYAVFYATVFHFGFNILFFAYGTYLIDKDAGVVSRFEPKRLLNPGVIAGVLALAIYFFKLKLPPIILEPMGFIGGITTPLSMIVIGGSLAGSSLGAVFREKKLYIFSLIRLVIIPAIAFLVMRLLTDDAAIIGIVTVTMGMPVAALVAMSSAPYEKQGTIASASVVMTTLLSMITIPIMALLLNQL